MLATHTPKELSLYPNFLWERAVLAPLADTKVIPPHPRKSVICGVLAQMRSAIYPEKLTADSECRERPDSHFSLTHTLICVTMLSYFFSQKALI